MPKPSASPPESEREIAAKFFVACKSIRDELAEWDLARKLRHWSDFANGIEPVEKNAIQNGATDPNCPVSVNFVSEIQPRPDDPSCHICGAVMSVKEWKCLACGTTTGCGDDTRELREALRRIISAIKEFGQEMDLAKRTGFPFMPSAGLCRRCDEALEAGERVLAQGEPEKEK